MIPYFVFCICNMMKYDLICFINKFVNLLFLFTCKWKIQNRISPASVRQCRQCSRALSGGVWIFGLVMGGFKFRGVLFSRVCIGF